MQISFMFFFFIKIYFFFLFKKIIIKKNGYLEIVETLIENGADMERKNEDGDTALMLAVRSEHLSIVDTLCKRGCSVSHDSVDYAKNKRNLYLSDMLLKHQASFQEKAKNETIEERDEFEAQEEPSSDLNSHNAKAGNYNENNNDINNNKDGETKNSSNGDDEQCLAENN